MPWSPAATAWIDPPRSTHPSTILSALAFSADGQRLAAILSTPTGPVAECHALAAAAPARRVPPDPDDARAARHRPLPHHGPWSSVALSADGRFLAGRTRADLVLCETTTGTQVAARTGFAGPTSALAFSPDGAWLVSGIDRASAALWRVPALERRRSFPADGHTLAVAFSPDGALVALAGQDRVVRLWSLERDEPPVVLRGPIQWIHELAFSPDGATLAAASGARIHLWRSGAAPAPRPARVPPPWSETLLEPNARRPAAHGSGQDFRARALAVPWFSRLMTPSPWDHGCTRLAGWDDWPGPESEAAAIFAQEAAWHGEIELVAQTFGRTDLLACFDEVTAALRAVAGRVVAHDPDEDAHHGPSTCVRHAASVVALVACYLELGWPVPDDLEERWAWFSAGHWPCGFAYERRSHTPPFRLLVL